MFPFLAFTGQTRFLWRTFGLGWAFHSWLRKSRAVPDTTQSCGMIEKRRNRRGKKPGPKPLPRELKRRRITIALTPKYHKRVAAHKSPGMFVEHCISRSRRITREQYRQLVKIHFVTGKTVDKLVHEAVKGYLACFSHLKN
jgi:hypothetical protein